MFLLLKVFVIALGRPRQRTHRRRTTIIIISCECIPRQVQVLRQVAVTARTRRLAFLTDPAATTAAAPAAGGAVIADAQRPGIAIVAKVRFVSPRLSINRPPEDRLRLPPRPPLPLPPIPLELCHIILARLPVTPRSCCPDHERL